METVLREMDRQDPRERNYVCKSFLRSFRGNHPIKLVPDGIYYREQQRIIDMLLEHSTVLMAVHPDDAEEIVGFVICQRVAPETIVIHYLYTRVRGAGVATQLLRVLRAKLVIATHMVDDFARLRHRAKLHGVQLVYDPYHLFRLTRGEAA